MTLFGIPSVLRHDSYSELLGYMRRLWEQQIRVGPKTLSSSGHLSNSAFDGETLVRELALMKHWFDPVASGNRVREAIRSAPPKEDPAPEYSTAGIVEVGESSALLSLEGRAILWVLERNISRWDEPSESSVFLSTEDCFFAVSAVQETHRAWVQQKLRGASALMREETSTLRPTAAGLLLFMLLNRHTNLERGLPIPASAERSETISDAIAGPVLAFARGISGSEKASDRGVDLYRGWALGEIQRRLGDDLMKADGRVWIEESAVERATLRLAESVNQRLAGHPDRLSEALSETLKFYEDSRSRLAALGIANERPANTARLFESISNASANAGGLS